jgi:hypothetical protein
MADDIHADQVIAELLDIIEQLKRKVSAAEELIGLSRNGERFDCRVGDEPTAPLRRKKLSKELMIAAERVAIAFAYGRMDLDGMNKLRKLVAEATYLDLRSMSASLAVIGDMESAQSLTIGDTLLGKPVLDAMPAAQSTPAE